MLPLPQKFQRFIVGLPPPSALMMIPEISGLSSFSMIGTFPLPLEPEPDNTVLSSDWLFATSLVPPPESFSWVVLELVDRSTLPPFHSEDFKTTITSTFPTPSTDLRRFLIRLFHLGLIGTFPARRR